MDGAIVKRRRHFEVQSSAQFLGGLEEVFSFPRLLTLCEAASPSALRTLSAAVECETLDGAVLAQRLWGAREMHSRVRVGDLLEAAAAAAAAASPAGSGAEVDPSPPTGSGAAAAAAFVSARVLYSFAAEQGGELSVVEGEVVAIVPTPPGGATEGWSLVAALRETGVEGSEVLQGFVPARFLQALGGGAEGEGGAAGAAEAAERSAAPPLPPPVPQPQGAAQAEAAAVAAAAAAAAPSADSTACLASSPPAASSAAAPSLAAASAAAAAASASAAAAEAAAFSPGQPLLACFSFSAEGPGELSVSKGERLAAEAASAVGSAEAPPPGWTLVSSAAGGLGFVPTSYLVAPPPASAAPLDAAVAAVLAPPVPAALLGRSWPQPQAGLQQLLQPPQQPQPQPQPSQQQLPSQHAATADLQYARGYLDALSRLLMEARLALREAEQKAGALGIGQGELASALHKSSQQHFVIPSTSARTLRQGGPGGAPAAPATGALAVLQAHVEIVTRLEAEAASALESAERSSRGGRRRAPPPAPAPAAWRQLQPRT